MFNQKWKAVSSQKLFDSKSFITLLAVQYLIHPIEINKKIAMMK